MSGILKIQFTGHIVVWFTIINFCCALNTKSELHVGPWGGRGGKMWTYEPKGVISHITVTYDDVVHSICFTSIDENGNLDKSKFPCTKATKSAEIDIDVKTEKLNGISGTFDTLDNCSKTITSLSFTTSNNKTYGPFGTVKGTDFSLVVEDQGFTGFYVRSGWVLDSIGVSLDNPSTQKTEDTGFWGGFGGYNEYDYMPKGMLSSIFIKYEDSIRSITITSVDENGVTDTSTRIGGADQNVTKGAEIVLDTKNGERLVGISGTVGTYQDLEVITSLKFYTNKNKSFGPYGGGGGFAFSYMTTKDKYIAGIYGRYGDLLVSIGMHIKAQPLITFGEWGNTTAGSAWSYQPYFGISNISLTYKDAIYSITFTNIDGNGTITSTKKIGKSTGSEKAEIVINPKNEKFSGISGTVDYKKGVEVITSLTFLTDNNRTFGPYGSETGTAFSAVIRDGFISGFHGRSSKWIQAFGLFVKSV